jgi:hypothetical protein
MFDRAFRGRSLLRPVALTAFGAAIFFTQTEFEHRHGYFEPWHTLLFVATIGFESSAAVLFWQMRPRRSSL